MGETKVEETTHVTNEATQQATPTPEESELNRLRLEQYRQTAQPQTDVQLRGLSLIEQLLSGSTDLPGFFGQMGEGISPETIGTTATRLAGEALPGFQDLGLLDSGVMGKEISRSIANELLFPAEQFNIGAKQNLLNLALSGQAQVQQPITAGNQLLGAQLAGLRSVRSTGTGTTTGTTSRNPFLESFYGSLGTTLGSPKFSAGPFSF